MTETEFKASAEDRSRFFWWLAEWFVSPPNPDKLASLPKADAAATNQPMDAGDIAWQALVDAASRPPSMDALGVEFTRLVRGIQEGLGPPPPFESVWRENRLIGESTVAVIDAYAKAGFADIAPEAGPQDHISVELKFIALLALREAEAWQANDAATARQRLIQQHDFLNAHLAAWAPRWADAIIQQAREPLFAALAGLVKAGLGQAAAELGDIPRGAANATADTHASHRH
jgi:TorA maturation chaperone TorD